MKKTAIAIFAALTALAGCNTLGCLDNQSAIPLAAFYDSSTGKAIGVNGLSVKGVGAPHDSTLLSGSTVKQVYLPMRSTATSTEWTFTFDVLGVSVVDTIAFSYSPEPFFASEDCGAMYNYRITSCRYTTNALDSVVIADSLITNADAVKIKIYIPTYDAP